MKTITQTTITGQVQEVNASRLNREDPSKNDYLIEFVIKAIQEGQAVWLNATTSPWKSWNLKEGDQVTVTGQLTSSVWENPFDGEELITLEMDATDVSILAA